ncbi:MAG: homoserine kinase [candidate division KSB1 bacterium]|jgi:homoserine kinase|nr:homoserine kinase [candidate division KSB1 bacterium]
MNETIRVFAPATVANVACGFDILGFALKQPGDEVVLKKRDGKGVRILAITGDDGKLPRDVRQNTAGIAASSFLNHIEAGYGLDIELHKKMPLGSGLGSSAASAVASVVGANALFGNPLSREGLLEFAMEGERVACGAAHADNAAPALLGGFTLIRSYDPLDVISIPTPDKLFCTVIHPGIEIMTGDARKILRKDIRLKDAIVQWGNVAGLITGLMTSDYELIGRSMQDVIIEPIRSMLIPGFQDIKNAAVEAGALGCSISGSGPSVFALSRNREIAGNAGKHMAQVLRNLGVKCTLYVSKINKNGPVILSSDVR